jgi:serine/threonine-protein kinase
MGSVTTLTTTPVAIGASDQDLAVGTEVGEYQIEAVIGKGGFGTVYRAVHPLIGKLVAIKVLSRKYSSDPAVVSRFVAEARAVNQIRHRNIIDIFLFSQLPDGRHYYVMEHLDGEALDAYLRAGGAMSLDDAMPILRAIARALDAAHAKGIAHRDLKPENIFLASDQDGGVFPKLLDFGIAKLLAPEDDQRHRTGTGVPLGTPYYMSPEQCRGRDVDHRTDIYSCGILAFRMLTGTYPFEGEDYVELLFKQVNEEAPLASSRNAALPASVDTAIAWMMRKDREQRPRTVLEGVLALDPTSAVTPGVLPKRQSRPGVSGGPASTPDAFAATTANPPATIDPAKPPAKSRRTVWIGAALVLVCSVGGVMLMLQSSSSERAPSATAANGPRDRMVTAKPDPGSNAMTNDAVTPKPPNEAPPPPVETVTIDIANVPAHASTMYDGKRIALPAKIDMPKGTAQIELVVEAPGYEPLKLKLVPDASRAVATPMVHKRAQAPTPAGDHDIIDHNAIDFRKAQP